jgi:predicted enzyme related to lactoylglutathione lyase
MARITHFHISGDNPEQLVLFYEKTFQFVGNAQKLTQGNDVTLFLLRLPAAYPCHFPPPAG